MISRLLLCLLTCLALSGCQRLKSMFAQGDNTLDPCDPISNHYEGDRHFIERDFVTEDRTIDYQRLFEADRIYNSPCDPIRGKIRQKADE